MTYKTITIDYVDKPITRFSTNIVFEDNPSQVDISNQFDCNAMSLRECDMNDPTSVFGCKEFTAKCHHFTSDTNMEYGGKEYVIPANKESTKGYALVLDTITDECNPYHGDLVLVTSDPSRNAYSLICECKQPGFIGNDTILGNCTTIRICNGKIDDINQPFEDIQCVCEDAATISEKTEGAVPVCVPLTIVKANSSHADWSDLLVWPSGTPTIEKSAYSIDIAGNLNTSKLVDPCKVDLLTGKSVQGSEYSSTLKACTITDPKYAYPITNTHLADEKESINYVLSANFDSVSWISTTGSVISSFGGLGSIPSIESTPVFAHSDFDKPTYIFKDPVAINYNYQPIRGSAMCPKVACQGNWPSYNCALTSVSPTTTKCGIPVGDHSSAPSTFPWGASSWGECESMFTEPSIACDVLHNGGHPAYIKYDVFNAVTPTGAYNLNRQLANVFQYNSSTDTKREILFSNKDMFELQFENITPVTPDK